MRTREAARVLTAAAVLVAAAGLAVAAEVEVTAEWGGRNVWVRGYQPGHYWSDWQAASGGDVATLDLQSPRVDVWSEFDPPRYIVMEWSGLPSEIGGYSVGGVHIQAAGGTQQVWITLSLRDDEGNEVGQHVYQNSLPIANSPPFPPVDTDGDGWPDAYDSDDDNDGVPDAEDPDPLNPNVPNPQGPDTDGDGTPDEEDDDDDDDGIPDEIDGDPLNAANPRRISGSGCTAMFCNTSISVDWQTASGGTGSGTLRYHAGNNRMQGTVTFTDDLGVTVEWVVYFTGHTSTGGGQIRLAQNHTVVLDWSPADDGTGGCDHDVEQIGGRYQAYYISAGGACPGDEECEGDHDCDGVPDDEDPDADPDGDGIPNIADPDDDGDGIFDPYDPDHPDYEGEYDDDGDGIPNKDDPDWPPNQDDDDDDDDDDGGNGGGGPKPEDPEPPGPPDPPDPEDPPQAETDPGDDECCQAICERLDLIIGQVHGWEERWKRQANMIERALYILAFGDDSLGGGSFVTRTVGALDRIDWTTTQLLESLTAETETPVVDVPQLDQFNDGSDEPPLPEVGTTPPAAWGRIRTAWGDAFAARGVSWEAPVVDEGDQLRNMNLDLAPIGGPTMEGIVVRWDWYEPIRPMFHAACMFVTGLWGICRVWGALTGGGGD